MKTEDILAQREQTHGDYRLNAKVSQALIDIIQDYMGENWDVIRSYQRHSLQMIAMKIARIVVGDPDEKDHWADIAGYAELTVRELESEVTTDMRANSHPASYFEKEESERQDKHAHSWMQTEDGGHFFCTYPGCDAVKGNEKKPCSHDWQAHKGFYVCRECGATKPANSD
jgi:hypothetical protein